MFRGVSARGGEDCRDTQRQHRFRGDDHELGVHLPPLIAHKHLFALPVPVPKMKKEDTPIDDSRAGIRSDAWCRSRADYASGGKWKSGLEAMRLSPMNRRQVSGGGGSSAVETITPPFLDYHLCTQTQLCMLTS